MGFPTLVADATSERFVLPALIPHAVVNRDVTLHLSAKGWIEVTTEDAAVGDGVTKAARVVRSSISLHTWCQDQDDAPFSAARLGSLLPVLRIYRADLYDALWTADALRSFLLDEPYCAAALENAEAKFADTVSPFLPAPDGCPGNPQRFVRAAVAWLRASPSRRPVDLPRFNTTKLCDNFLHHAVDSVLAALPLLAPTVEHVVFGHLEADALVVMLPRLPAVWRVDVPGIVLKHFVARLRSAIEASKSDVECEDSELLLLPQRLTCFQEDTDAAALSVTSGLFLNCRSVSLHDDDARDPTTWQALAQQRRLEELNVTIRSFGEVFADSEDGEAVETHDPVWEGSVVGAFQHAGRTLTALSINTNDMEFPMTTPCILGAIQKHCMSLRRLQIENVRVGSSRDFFAFIAQLHQLRALTLNRLTFSNVRGSLCTDLNQLPAALPHLEILRMANWPVVVPCLFVQNLATKSHSLVEWKCDDSVRFERASRAVWSDTCGSGCVSFPRLRSAKVPFALLCVVARAQKLRFLFGVRNDDVEHIDSTLVFASPYVQLVLPFSRSSNVPAIPVLKKLRHSKLHAMSCVCVGTDPGPDDSDVTFALPDSLRELTVFSHVNTPISRQELFCLLNAAKATAREGSLLTSLKILHPPSDTPIMDCLCSGFPKLQHLSVAGFASDRTVLRTVCRDLMLDARCGFASVWWEQPELM